MVLRAGVLSDPNEPDIRVMTDGGKTVRRTAYTVVVSPDVVHREDWYE